MKLLKSTVFISIASLLSRLLGVLRENLLASAFGGLAHGSVNPLDAYYVAFDISDFIYNLVIMSVGAAIFVPIFARELKKNHDQIHTILNNFLNVAFIFLTAGSILIYLLLPWLLPLIAPGFAPEQRELSSNLIRIILLSPIFFGISTVLSSYLSVYKNFMGYIWSPIVYNLSIIVSILVLVPLWGVYGVAYGVAFGAFLHAFIQFFPLLKQKYRYRWVYNLRVSYMKEVGRLVLPRIIGVSASQISLLIDTLISSTLVAGSITIFNWAQNIQYLPVGLIGISISITAFTVLSDFAAEDNKKQFTATLLQNIRIILFLSLPITVGFFLLRASMVDLIFNYGKFSANAENLALTSSVLGIFVLSLLFQGLIPLLTRAFYSYQNTRTPVMITLAAVLINTVGSIVFVLFLHWGLLGLALSFTLSNTFNALMLWYLLNKKIVQNMISVQAIAPFLQKTFLATALMTLGCLLVHSFLGSLGTGKIFTILDLIGTALTGGVFFFIAARLLHLPEADFVLARMLPFVRKFKINSDKN